MINLLDLFCGAGGLSLGFSETKKYKIVGAVDNWKPATETFQFNHKVKSDEVLCANMDEIYDKKSKLFNFIKNIDRVDIVVGGPPCQGMSLAGKRLSDDPRNLLFKTFVEVVKITKPQCFLMENVTGLLSFENGKINHAIINSFKEIGYDTFNTYSPTIMKAEMYGVPQIRRRLFYVGFKNKVNKLVWPPKPLFREYSNKIINNYNLFDDNEDIPSPYTVSDAISDLPILKAGEGEDEVSYNSLKKIKNEFQKEMRDWFLCPRRNIEKKLYNHVSPNNTIDLIKKILKTDEGGQVDDNYADSKKWHSKKPGFTVKALGAGGGSTNRRAFHYDKNQPRGSTVRENARVQSFPDWFRFLSSKTNQMSLVGNSVPPKLAFNIAKSLSKVF